MQQIAFLLCSKYGSIILYHPECSAHGSSQPAPHSFRSARPSINNDAAGYFAATAKTVVRCYLDVISNAGDSAAGLRQQLADASDIASSSAAESAMGSSPRPGIFSSMLSVLSLGIAVQACESMWLVHA